VTTAVYYQSIEAIVALKFLGNMADTNNNFVLEPCVLGGLCDGRTPATEPPVVEGAPPVPMVVRNLVIGVDGTQPDRAPLAVTTYPPANAERVYDNPVIKVFFSKPVLGVDERSLLLTDSRGSVVPSSVDQIGSGTWGLFPNQIVLKAGETYHARLRAGVCDYSKNCTKQDIAWTFTVSKDSDSARGNTDIPLAFALPAQEPAGIRAAQTRGRVPAAKPLARK
jgi:hypothetical protein